MGEAHAFFPDVSWYVVASSALRMPPAARYVATGTLVGPRSFTNALDAAS